MRMLKKNTTYFAKKYVEDRSKKTGIDSETKQIRADWRDGEQVEEDTSAKTAYF